MAIAYHAALPHEWADAQAAGVYAMSTRGLTLEQEGFIHCSTREQVEGVANRFYADLEELSLLTVDLDRVGSDVRWEPPVPGADELYPHIYGPLPVSAVTAVRTWRRGNSGWSFDLLT
jgi:glutathione S-transferase